MKTVIGRSLLCALVFTVFSSFYACQGGGTGGVTGNEAGSDPINTEEAKAYKKAVLRCYKTGGSRVVKIEGKLNCY